MKIIYLHDPKAGASVLHQLEDILPMLEIVNIDIEEDFDAQFGTLKKLFGQFTSYVPSYAIVADGFGIAYASYFTCIKVKGQKFPVVTILLNPDYRAVRDVPAFKKLPKHDFLKEDCLHSCFGCMSIFCFDNYNLLAYHQQHYGGNYLLLPPAGIFPAIKDLICKSAIGSVSINYLRKPI